MTTKKIKDFRKGTRTDRTVRGPISIYGDKRLYQKFQTQCRKQGTTGSAVIQKLMTTWLDRAA